MCDKGVCYVQGVFCVNEDDFASSVAACSRQLSRHCSDTLVTILQCYYNMSQKNEPLVNVGQTFHEATNDMTRLWCGAILLLIC